MIRWKDRVPNRDRDPFQWLYAWVLPVLALAAGAWGPLLIESASDTWKDRVQEPPFWAGVAILAFAICVTVWLGIHTTQSAKRARGTLTAFNDALGDTIRSLGRLLGSDKTAAAQEQFFRDMVAEAKSLVPLPSPRICVYLLDAHEAEDGPEEFLRLVATGGRSDPPRQVFEDASEHGKSTIAVTQARVLRCVDDHGNPPSDIILQRDPNSLWKAFMMVPLHVNGEPRGLLCIDTPEQMRFTREHMAVAQTIGSFIELGMQDVAGAAADTAPEVREVLGRLGVQILSADGTTIDFGSEGGA